MADGEIDWRNLTHQHREVMGDVVTPSSATATPGPSPGSPDRALPMDTTRNTQERENK